MGVYTDLIAAAVAWDAGGTDGISVATDRVIMKDIAGFQARQGDPAAPAGYAEADEIQTIGTYNGVVSGGNFTLTITLRNGETVTTANIAHDALAAAIEGAIDTVATGNITDWTNADISVALTGNLTANAATITFDGASVDATNHPAIVMNDVDLSGGGTSGNVATTTNGQTARLALAALNVMGIIDSPPPPQGTTSVTALATRESHPWFPRQETLKALAKQAEIEDAAPGLYGTLLAAMDSSHLA